MSLLIKMQRKLVFLLGGLFIIALIVLPSLTPATPADGQPKPQTAALQASPTSTLLAATATPVPATVTPAPWTFPAGSEVAGVAVGGLTTDAARTKVGTQLKALARTLTVAVGDQHFTFNTGLLLTLPAVDTLIKQATTLAHTQAVKLPLRVEVDRRQLLERLDRERAQIEQDPVTDVISDAKSLTQTLTFVAQPGISFDPAVAADQISSVLTDTTVTTLALTTTVVAPSRPTLGQLEQALELHAGFWKGIAGFYVYDTATGQSIGYHDDTVFSGASVMKVPIMIFAYSRLGQLNAEQREWLRLVIDESKNIEANNLLAAAVGGSGTEDALTGVNEMSAMLRDLGLKHTYMVIPYESGQYLIQISKLPHGGPAREGSQPYTDADPYLRTTPGEMGRLFVMLSECSQGHGPLIEKYGDHLNAAICNEMMNALRSPHDQERMVAGLPVGTSIAHKGGWTEDFQGDVGIVDSPNGRYVAAIYIYRDLKDGYVSDPDANPSPYLGDFSHTIYTFFNPVTPAALAKSQADATASAHARATAAAAPTAPAPNGTSTATP